MDVGMSTPLVTSATTPASSSSPGVGVAAEPFAGLGRAQELRKRAFDVAVASAALVVLSPFIAVAYVAAALDTKAPGFFRQERIGRNGARFTLLKIRSMRVDPTITTSVTTVRDPRITRLGRFWRRTKIDELPQLWNVIRGDMSLVGPRPEVPGFADLLTGSDAQLLAIRPGITGPASIHFRNEEELLAAADDPEAYNRDVLFPAKVRMNLDYIRSYSFRRDIVYLWRTVR
jgi:lipopolysaccharide/colanic/teichoic acid biosynthesis glycosyltransferase